MNSSTWSMCRLLKISSSSSKEKKTAPHLFRTGVSAGMRDDKNYILSFLGEVELQLGWTLMRNANVSCSRKKKSCARLLYKLSELSKPIWFIIDGAINFKRLAWPWIWSERWVATSTGMFTSGFEEVCMCPFQAGTRARLVQRTSSVPAIALLSALHFSQPLEQWLDWPVKTLLNACRAFVDRAYKSPVWGRRRFEQWPPLQSQAA